MIMMKRTALLSLFLVAAADISAATAQDAGPPLEIEVAREIQNQPVGNNTIEDFALPDEFVRRVADRVVRIQYQNRYRMVYDDESEATRDDASDASSTPGTNSPRWPPMRIALFVAVLSLLLIAVWSHRKRRARQ